MKRVLSFFLSLMLVFVMTAEAVAPQGTTSYSTVISTEPQEEYTVGPSTPTPRVLRQMRQNRPRNAPIRQLKAVQRKIRRVIKKTAPNPNVQAPSAYPMPANAPVMPIGPQMPPRPTAGERFLGAVAKVMTKTWGPNIFVWLPAISTDPNAGPTGGVLPVMVLADSESRHIRHLLAPSYTYNPLFGQTGTMRYYWYPTDASQFVTIGSYSEHTNREIKVRYENTSLLDGTMYLRTEASHNVDGSRRFFGIGPQTHEGDETGYTARDTVAHVAAGVNFFHSWRATFGERFRRMTADTNIVPNITDLAVRFPSLTGIGTQNTVASEFRLLWDTRDLPITPSRGSSGELFVEKTSVAMGSDADYIRYGLEGKRFFLWNNPRHVTVIHGLYEWANGPNIPFYELPQLGGRETLRGYGEGRLADKGRIVMNVEHRITFASLALMGIHTNFEVAPFFDIGSVFPTLPQVARKNFRPVYGGAFRAAVKPNVVGDVEVGVGKEGAAVFVDIDYPF
jgi:hypothetical protein